MKTKHKEGCPANEGKPVCLCGTGRNDDGSAKGLRRVGIGNLGQPLYSETHPAPKDLFQYIVMGFYGTLLVILILAIFTLGYWLGHVLAVKG